MNLTIDVGNSLIKMAVFQDSKLLHKMILLKSEFKKKFEELTLKFPDLKNIIVSNVSKHELPGIKKMMERFKVIFLSPEIQLPFINKYTTPTTLGNDRKALAAAASRFFKNENVLVIDAGTCITMDFLNSKNEFLGGSISPGIKMRYEALHNFTSKLPLLEPADDAELIGNSTRSAINSGILNGVIKEIDGFIEDYKLHYEDLKVVLTGGDMLFLSKRLKSSIFANSNFLLEGLNYILEINEDQ